MRLTRRIVLPTGLEIRLGVRPLPPDRAEAAPDDGRDEAMESTSDIGPNTGPSGTVSPRID